MFAPCLESTFQHPYVVNAYPFQTHGCSRAYRVASRRRIENDLDIIRDSDMRRLSQQSGIHPESTGNSLHAFTVSFFFEVRQIEHCDLAFGFQFACEHRRADAAQPQLTDHSHQSQPPPADIENDRNPDRDTEGGPKMLDPTNGNLQFIREEIAEPYIDSLTKGSYRSDPGQGNRRPTLLPRRQGAA